MRTIFFLLIVIVAGTLGEIAITHAMKRIGEVTRFTPRAILAVLARAFRQGWMWCGFGLMALSFFAMLALLSWENVSLVIPASAANYIVGAIGAKFLLHEQVSRQRWLGVLLVTGGVVLVFLGR